jgi:hypothetical protein
LHVSAFSPCPQEISGEARLISVGQSSTLRHVVL